VDASDDFERVAPAPFSVVCFRARGEGDAGDALNERILERINAGGEIFISHTKLNGRYVLRLAVGNLHTTEEHVARAWGLLQSTAHELRSAETA
jgi:aromatic-L-amino-acid decarboxylase